MFDRLLRLFHSLPQRFHFWLHPEPEPLRVTDSIVLGDMADQLLKHPLLNAVIAGIGERYRAELEAVKLGDTSALTLAHMKLHALADVVNQLKARIGNGKLEQSRIDTAKKREAAYKKAVGEAV